MTILSDAPDLAVMRAERRRRLFVALAAANVDVLILSRPAEVAFATGARQLWVAGSRPFGPAAIAVTATGRIHLLATSEDGVPPEVDASDLFGLSWNPANLQRAVAGIPGLATARRIATTSSTPGFESFIRRIARDAEIVDGAAIINAVRAPKTADELDCIVAATALAHRALVAMEAALVSGTTERALLGVYLGRLGELGAPTPPTEGVVCATATTGPVQLRRIATTRPIEAGQLVVLDVSADVAGYEGGLATTKAVGSEAAAGDAVTDAHHELARRCFAMLEALVAACVPDATGADLRTAATSGGEPLPDEPIVVGVGLGVEPPVVDPSVGGQAALVRHQVVSVGAWVTAAGIGGWFERRLVVVDEPPRLVDPSATLEENDHG